MKHFEELWEEAEKLSASSSFSINEIIIELVKDLKNLVLSDNKNYLMGKIIFNLACISYKYNINVYTALVDSINDFRSSQLELEENE